MNYIISIPLLKSYQRYWYKIKLCNDMNIRETHEIEMKKNMKQKNYYVISLCNISRQYFQLFASYVNYVLPFNKRLIIAFFKNVETTVCLVRVTLYHVSK